MKPYVLAFSHSGLCRKIGQDQPKVTICAIMVVLGYLMLHTKFQGHWSTGSGEDFLKVFTIYGHIGPIGHVTLRVCTYFHSLCPRRLYKKFGYIWPSGFRGDFSNCHTMRVLVQRSNNDHDLFYFIYSLRQLYLLILRPKSSKLSMKFYVFAFSHIRPCCKKRSRINPRSPLEQS